MNSQRRPLLLEDGVSLQALRAIEAGPGHAGRRSDGGNSGTASLGPLHPPTTHYGPGLYPPFSSGSKLSWTYGEGQATANSPLLPRALARWTKKRSGVWVFLEAYLMFAVSGLIGWAAYILIGGSVDSGSSRSPAVECNSQSATGAERLFLVNLEVAPGLSFTQAKMLDLAWDTFIGQGLRFLHAWMLYYIIARCLTAAMESNAVPHRAYLDLQFSTVSLQSIYSAASLISSRKPVRSLRLGFGLLFEIAYVLSFATIWSATTGYISASVPTFAIGELSHVSVPSPELTFCWVIDDDRISPANSTKVITGPQVKSLPPYKVHPLNDYWSHEILHPPREPSRHGTDNFIDIHSYFLTKSLIEILPSSSLYGETLDLENYKERTDAVVTSSAFFYRGGVAVQTNKPFWNRTTTLSNIRAWQLEEASHIPKEQRVVLGNNTLNSTTAIAARKATFLANATVARDTPSKLPYNSTVWIDGKEIPLQAPFLETSSACYQWRTPLANDGVCLCTAGVPVKQAIDLDSPTGCLGDAGYSWGFSGGVLGVAVVLEFLWLCLAWAMWRWAPRQSSLVAGGRPGAGRIRNILDAAEAITGHLGDQHSAYTEKELEARLRGARPFGYVLETRRGVQHIGIRSIPSSDDGTRLRAQVEKGMLYG